MAQNKVSAVRRQDRLGWIDPDEGSLSIVRQCELAQLSRASYYGEPARESEENLELMRSIDELYLRYPFLGSRKLAHRLGVNRKRVQRLMRIMGIEAIFAKPRLWQRCPEHRICPYLLRGVEIVRRDQVWSTDITYVPMPRGFMYLTAIVDWFSRYVLAWEISNTLDVTFCLAALARSRPCAQRFSTPIRDHSLRAKPLPDDGSRPRSRSAWMVEAGGSTTCLSNGCGGQ